MLIAQHQLDLVRVTVENSRQPVVIADAGGRILLSNDAFLRQFRTDASKFLTLDELVGAFTDSSPAKSMLRVLRERRLPWRGELSLHAGAAPLPVGVRADVVIGAQATILGFILIFTDLSENKRADAARRHLEDALYQASRSDARSGTGSSALHTPDEVIGAILANTRLATLDIADGCGGTAVAPLIEELENATRRATSIYAQLLAYARGRK